MTVMIQRIKISKASWHTADADTAKPTNDQTDWWTVRVNNRLMEEEEMVQGYRDRIITQAGSSVGDEGTQEVIDWAGQI